MNKKQENDKRPVIGSVIVHGAIGNKINFHLLNLRLTYFRKQRISNYSLRFGISKRMSDLNSAAPSLDPTGFYGARKIGRQGV